MSELRSYKHLEIYQLRALRAVVEYGGVSHAAKELDLTQGAVSIQIKRLEELVGEELFTRKGRSMALTPAGEVMLGYADQILTLNDKSFAHLSSGKSNLTLNFGIPPDIANPFLTQIIQEFSTLHPTIKLRPYFNNSVELLNMFNLGRLDFAVGVDVTPMGQEIKVCSVCWYYCGDTSITSVRPLPIIMGDNASARKMVSQVLDEHSISHEYLPSAADVFASAAIVDSGLAVTVTIDRPGGQAQFFKVPCGLLPELPEHRIFINYSRNENSEYLSDLAKIATQVFQDGF